MYYTDISGVFLKIIVSMIKIIINFRISFTNYLSFYFKIGECFFFLSMSRKYRLSTKMKIARLRNTLKRMESTSIQRGQISQTPKYLQIQQPDNVYHIDEVYRFKGSRIVWQTDNVFDHVARTTKRQVERFNGHDSTRRLLGSLGNIRR